MAVEKIRVVVTGHDRAGRSIIASDRAGRRTHIMHGVKDFAVTDLWRTFGVPADNDRPGDGCVEAITLAPPKKGIVLRVVQFPPDSTYVHRFDRARAFASMGKSGASAMASGAAVARHPMMHRTVSEDYAIVLKGQAWCVMDKGEALLKAGDILVQRGTNHAWSNRAKKPCLICFVQIDAKPSRSAPKKGKRTR